MISIIDGLVDDWTRGALTRLVDSVARFVVTRSAPAWLMLPFSSLAITIAIEVACAPLLLMKEEAT
jgi:hypothetical protein